MLHSVSNLFVADPTCTSTPTVLYIVLDAKISCLEALELLLILIINYADLCPPIYGAIEPRYLITIGTCAPVEQWCPRGNSALELISVHIRTLWYTL